MLCLTLSLGFWQVRRLHWKLGILTEIELSEQSAPVPLSADPRPFERVLVTGVFRPQGARYGVSLRTLPGRGPVLGGDAVNPMDATTGEVLLIDRGWAPFDDDNLKVPTGMVEVTGYVRPPEHTGALAIQDDPVSRRFFSLDPAGIGKALGLAHVAPFVIVALGHGTDELPQPATTLPRPPNDHLSYAITWFSLSAVLVCVFIVYAVKLSRRVEAQ